LERERELEALGRALSDAQRGLGRISVISGSAGIGKTSLLRAASDLAVDSGFACLRARASELERDFAYGCIRQLLEPAGTRVSDSERDRMFAGAAALSRVLFVGPETQPASRVDSFAMLHGLYWLVNNLADEQPVLLCIDDLQWSDPESVRFLSYLAPRLDGLRVAVLASSRPGGDGIGEVDRLVAAPETSVLRPQPLSAEATAMLCRRRLGPAVAPAFVDACCEATGGNPFYLEALLRDISERGVPADAGNADRVRGIGPAAVAHAVLLRLSGRPAASEFVRAAAVLGDGASLAEAADLADLAPEKAGGVADLLEQLGILKPAPHVEFAHPIVREAVYADMGSGRRAHAHARAERLLSARGASAERIGAQIVRALPEADQGRVALLRGLAGQAAERGAPAGAATWLRRALAEPPPVDQRAEVLLELGTAKLRSGAPGAAEHFEEAIELATEPDVLAPAARLAANALSSSGRSERAFDSLLAVIDRVEPDDRERALELEADIAAHSRLAGLREREIAELRLEQRGELAGETRGERLVLASRAFVRVRHAPTAREAAAIATAALKGGRLLADLDLDVGGAFYQLVFALLQTDELDAADECLRAGLAAAQARASIPAVAFMLIHIGMSDLRRGRLADGVDHTRAARDLLGAHRIALGHDLATAMLSVALARAGDAAAAEAELERSELARDVPAGQTDNEFLRARGTVRLAQGRYAAGVDDLVEYGRRNEHWSAVNPAASRWRSEVALGLAATGDRRRALALAAEDLELAHRWGAASGIGQALRASALIAPEVSIPRLREAVDALAISPERLAHARALIDLGSALRRANRRADSREPLAEGLELAAGCGARLLAQHARTELRAAGGPTSDPLADGVEQLTMSERRVAELAAQGHSNPEIAQSLFVTRKTVETHLGRVYRKLGIRGREQLTEHLPTPRST
jgi:DNA-binding CsgD family transcriptional regulator